MDEAAERARDGESASLVGYTGFMSGVAALINNEYPALLNTITFRFITVAIGAETATLEPRLAFAIPGPLD